jgi:phospholipid transport system substrate-binding protein
MTNRRLFLIASLVLLALSPWSGQRALADKAALSAFIQDLTGKAISNLSAAATTAERAAILKPILEKYFDMPTIAKHTLGAYWKRATPEEQKDYVAAFTDYMAAVYGKRFEAYAGQTLKVLRIREESGRATVFSVVEGQDPTPRVDWDVAGDNPTYMITDVRVDGLSLAETHRQEFAAVISSSGGKISALIEALRKKAGAI